MALDPITGFEEAAGGIADRLIDLVEKVLTSPIEVDLGADGLTVAGKRYTRGYGPGIPRESFDSRLTIRRIVIPSWVPLVIAGGATVAILDMSIARSLSQAAPEVGKIETVGLERILNIFRAGFLLPGAGGTSSSGKVESQTETASG